MAEAAVTIAVGTLKDLLLEEARFLYGVGGEVKALQSRLEETKRLLEDADRRQHESKSVRGWITEIRKLSYTAEDAIAAYAVEIASGGRGQGLKRLLDSFSRVLKGCYSLHQLGCEISVIKSDLGRLTKLMLDYGILDGGGASADNSTRKTFPHFEIDDCFVGKEDDVERVISLLLDDEKKHRVISIWGMAGIGKTTVAKRVYNHMIETKKDRFESFAWVCITQQFQTQLVLMDVLKQLDPERGEGVSSLSETQLVGQLCQIQRAKRCMIVVDDLWKKSHWDCLKHAFLVENLKSKILVTTRKQNVARIGFTLELGFLKMEDAWELLKKKAFSHSNIPEFASQEKIQRIGKEMVRKCGNLPLAISLLGGVLSEKHSPGEWESVNKNINASLHGGEGHDEEDNQIGVLNLSYEDLPCYLKLCFLYLGRLKEDESIYAADLYRMWIAQGMISKEEIRGDEETLTDVAERYLTELASRCVVQVELEDLIPTQKYKTCKLHDVMRDLCLSIGEKEDFGVQILEYQGGKFSKLLHEALSRTKTTRHLVIHFKKELHLERDDELTITRGQGTGKHLRSLELHGNINGKTIEFLPKNLIDFKKLKLLRGLVIVGFKFAGRKLPKGITNLANLRYLRLRECELDNLPSSISNLVYLDTLDLFLSRNVRIPDDFKKMIRLKHLLLPFYDKETIGNYRLIMDGGVYELESLIGFNSSVHELKHITRMENLRRLSASIYDNESLSAIIKAIATNWKKLSYCAVSIKQGCQLATTKEGMMNLKQAFSCPNLYILRIFVQLGKLLEESREYMSSSRLVRLYLFECEMEEDPMGTLGKIPFLRELYLESRSFVGEEMKCDALSFPSLTKVVLNDLPKLSEWRVEKGAMPRLSEIRIRRCPCLEKVPNGLRFISTLQKLVISGMPIMRKRVSASRGGRGGEDFHKVRHISSIIIN